MLIIMKKISIMAAFMAALFVFGSCDTPDKKVVDYGALPQAAQTFVKTYYPDRVVSVVLRDKNIFDRDYEVIFSDGANIDFTSKGEWTEVEDRDMDGVPQAILPAGIMTFVTNSHPDQVVVKISKDRHGYEVELSNMIELEFNQNGQLMDYDD